MANSPSSSFCQLNVETQPFSLIYILSAVAFSLQPQSCVVSPETVQPPKRKYLLLASLQRMLAVTFSMACCHRLVWYRSISSRNFLVTRVRIELTLPLLECVGRKFTLRFHQYTGSGVILLSHPLNTCVQALCWKCPREQWRSKQTCQLHPLALGRTPSAFLHDQAASSSRLAGCTVPISPPLLSML